MVRAWSFCHVSEEHGRQPSLSVGLPILTPWSTCPHRSVAGNVTGRTIGTGPLSSHSWIGQSCADWLSLKRHERSAQSRYLPRPQENTPYNGPCQLLHSLFPLCHLSSFPSEVTRRGYPRRKCLSSEGGACACCLFFPPPALCYFQHGPVSYRSYVMECWLLITGCQKKLRVFLTSFLVNPLIVVTIAWIYHLRKDSERLPALKRTDWGAGWTQLSPDFWDTSSFSEDTILEATE